MDKEITYKIKKNRKTKKIRLTVYCNGNVVITSPFGIKKSVLEKIINNKKTWIWDKIQSFKNVSNKYSHKDYLKNKNKVLSLVKEKIELYNKIYGFSFNKIFIKNQKTRWGSCSSKKNLNFNYKILFLPQKYQDYIIVHEICHLKELNHSSDFWDLVSKAFPDYLKIKKNLRNYRI